MAINSVDISNTDTILLEVPSGQSYAVTAILVCNTYMPNPLDENEGKTNFDMHFVKFGDPKSSTNKVINSVYLPAAETFSLDSEKIILSSGDKIVVVSEAPLNLSATVSYLEL